MISMSCKLAVQSGIRNTSAPLGYYSCQETKGQLEHKQESMRKTLNHDGQQKNLKFISIAKNKNTIRRKSSSILSELFEGKRKI
jgi:hypothetical protein